MAATVSSASGGRSMCHEVGLMVVMEGVGGA